MKGIFSEKSVKGYVNKQCMKESISELFMIEVAVLTVYERVFCERLMNGIVSNRFMKGGFSEQLMKGIVREQFNEGVLSE